MEHLTVMILGREYRLSCEPAERDTLLAAVSHVDASMQTIRDQGKIAGTERIAVFAALNIAGALLSQSARAGTAEQVLTKADEPQQQSAVADPAILRRMEAIHTALDAALADQQHLPIE